MKTIFSILALFFYTIVAYPSLNKLVVFGDSLSDNGNLYEYMKHQLPLSPPYYKGRFTNGLVWVELVANHYYPTDANAHLLDYAFGGAGVLEGDDIDDDLFTLRREMDSYFLSHQDKADEKALYIVWIGSNNYLAMPDDIEKSLTEVTTGIKHGLERLASKGAKHVLVVNLPDLGRIPAARDFDSVDVLSYLAKQHNDTLLKNLHELQQTYPDTQWLFFDVNQLFYDIMDHPGEFGFDNTTGTCYEEMAVASSHSILKMVASVKPKLKKDACTGYVFFDPVHPSGLAHQYMTERALQLFELAGVEFK